MKIKASDSLKAAQRLVDAHETYGYNSSVHCSYYAILQYMKYILANTSKSPIPYSSQNTKGQSSHIYILNEVLNRIDNLKSKRIIRDNVKWLKSERKEADYTQKTFDQEESLDCIDKAKGIISKLNQCFGL